MKNGNVHNGEEFFSPDKHNFSQEYWVYFKKNWGSVVEKGLPLGHVDIFQTSPSRSTQICETKSLLARPGIYVLRLLVQLLSLPGRERWFKAFVLKCTLDAMKCSRPLHRPDALPSRHDKTPSLQTALCHACYVLLKVYFSFGWLFANPVFTKVLGRFLTVTEQTLDTGRSPPAPLSPWRSG